MMLSVPVVTMRPYAGEPDLERVFHLMEWCEQVDQRGFGISLQELRLDLSDPQISVQIWEDGQELPLALSTVNMPPADQDQFGYCWFRVRPDSRGQGFEQQAVAWAEAMVQQRAAALQRPGKLHLSSRDDDLSRMVLLESLGFARVRHSFTMERPLDLPIPAMELPAGFSLRSITGPEEYPAWVEAFNQSFIDHWNYHPLSVERFIQWNQSDNLRDDLNLVAVTEQNQIVAFCLLAIEHAENQRKGVLEGWVADLGSIRGFRRIGLGRNMLLAGLHRLKAEGLTTAMLGVDALNPNGALQLYQSVGFQVRYTWIEFAKHMERP